MELRRVVLFLALIMAVFTAGCVSDTPAAAPLNSSVLDSIDEVRAELQTALSSGGMTQKSHERLESRVQEFENMGYDVSDLRNTLSQIRVGAGSQSGSEQGNEKPVLQNLGVNFDPWDPATGRAGDFVFDVPKDKIFIEFVAVVDSDGGAKRIPEILYILPQGAQVFSPVDGTVSGIDELYSDDYSVHIKQDEDSVWTVSFEHLIDLRVQEGDAVSAGQVLGEAAPFSGGTYFTELAVWKGGATERDIVKLCPFSLLSDGLKPEYREKIHRLASDWEDFSGEDVYDQESWELPGCVFANITEYDALNPDVGEAQPESTGLFGQKCNDGPSALSVSPLSLSQLEFIVPQGRMSGSHVTPTDHQYWQPVGFEHGSPRNDEVRFDVFAPADGYVISAEQFRPGDYRLVLEHSCELYTIFIHLNELPGKIASEADFEGESHQYRQLRVPVSAGELIGRKDGRTFDFSVHDTSVRLSGFAAPERYDEGWKIHTVDPFDYFPEPLRSQLREKSLRSAEPVGGKIDYDIPGTIQGNWFLQGTGGYRNTQSERYWEGHLAIAYDHVDPSQIRVSLGDYEGKEAQFGVTGNAPLPSDVTQESGTVRYELTDFDYFTGSGGYWDRKSHAKPTSKNTVGVRGVLLVQHFGDSLKVEAFPAGAQVSGFTSAARIYER